MSSKHYMVVPAVLIITGLVGSLSWYRWNSNSYESDQLLLLGNVDIRQVNLAFRVGGRIETMIVDEGDMVQAGQLIATLDKDNLRDELHLAEAQLAAPQAALARLKAGSRSEEIQVARALVAEQQAILENARQSLQRTQTLAAQGVTPRQQHDDATAVVRVAEARLKSALESLALAEAGPRQEDIAEAAAQLRAAASSLRLSRRRLTDADLVAPNEGVILTRVREPGAIVAPGETIYLLSLSTPIWIRTYLTEPDLGRVTPGMPAEVVTDSGAVFAGRVGFISSTAEFTPKTVETRDLRTSLVYRIRIIVTDPDDQLRQGMPVTVLLEPEST